MRARGFTVLELMVASVIGMLALVTVFAALQASIFTVKTSTIQSTLDTQAATITDSIAKELRYASAGKSAALQIGNTHQSITFSICTGYANGAPVFGNPITYQLATYGGRICLERSETVNGVLQVKTVTDQLSGTARNVRTAQGIDRTVTGIYFETVSSTCVMVTAVVEKRNYLLSQNATNVDDIMWASSQASVTLLNK